MDYYRFLLIFVIVVCFHVVISASTGRVEYLPGFQGPLPFYLETGYVGVGKNEDVQLFYYFIQSESDPKNDPVMIWLTGGPGCSSFSGLVFEIGPLEFVQMHYNGSLPNLVLRPNSWTKIASIIFIDIPVGTGFSYATTTSAANSDNIQYAEHGSEFMKKWLNNHPEFISSPFYVGGSSYAGIPVPMITQLIVNGNEAATKPYINIKGYVLGNPKTFPDEGNFEIQFANSLGLISDELYKSLFDSCLGEYRSEYISPNNIACVQNLELYQQCIDGIDKQNILEPNCSASVMPIKLPSEMGYDDHKALSAFLCKDEVTNLAEYWANDASVREALHVRKGSIGKWVRCNWNVSFTMSVDDVRAYHMNLGEKGYRSLIFSGDHDMVVPHRSTERWIKGLNFSLVGQWRSWKLLGQIAGYTESYSNMMTYATVKGGGHTACESKPKECFTMFKRWISYQPL